MAIELDFKFDKDGVCLTPCPFVEKRKVGSWACVHICSSCLELIRDPKTTNGIKVICTRRKNEK